MPIELKLMAEYDCFPLWKAGNEFGNVNPDELPLTDGLKTALRHWSATYGETLNQHYPPDSGFGDQTKEDVFEAEGQRLWHELREQLRPAYSVIYYSIRDQRLYE